MMRRERAHTHPFRVSRSTHTTSLFGTHGFRKALRFSTKQAAARALSRLGVRHPWVIARPNPSARRPLARFKLYAVIGTWMEADVVEATVKNAFVQGCERVFVVDNDSPDETVQTAVAAGAELGRVLANDTWDDEQRFTAMNEVVAAISEADGAEHIWWLWLDADEFPHGPRGLTVREYLSSLDRSFRIVGARFVNHYPGEEPHYMPGFHPLDFQPLCEELSAPNCWSLHNKHSLQRFDRGGPAIECREGIHSARSSERPLLEPREAVFLHHFPFRRKEDTARRLEALFSGGGARGSGGKMHSRHAFTRLTHIDAVYEQDWERVGMYVAPEWSWKRPRLEPAEWEELAAPEDVPAARWYDASKPSATAAR